MKAVFAHNVHNVERLLAGLALVRQRGAAEACLMLVTSEPGYGKTETLRWYCTQESSAIMIRAKSGWTRHWFLRDLLEELGVTPRNLTEEMFRQAVEALSRLQTMLVIDEVEHALADIRVMEAIRDLTDLVECPTVLVGMARIQDQIRSRFPQISSRIATVVHFEPISVSDVRATASQLLDGVALEEDLVAEIHRLCEGRMRLALNALANCERIAKQRRATILSLADIEGIELIHDWRVKPLAALRPVRRRRSR